MLWLNNGLHDTRYESWQEEEVYLFSKTVDPSSKVHPTSYSMGAQPGLQPQTKGPGHEADYSPPSSAKIVNEWKCTSTYPMCLYRDKFTFLCWHFFQKSSSDTILVRLPLISHMITMRFVFTTKPTPPVCAYGDRKGCATVLSLTLSKSKILRFTLSRKYGLVHKPIVLAAGGSYIKQGFV